MKAFGLYTVCILASVAAHAQIDLENTGIIFINGTTDTLFVNGAFNNNATAGLTNNGQLYIRQNLTNNQSSMPIGTGRLLLTGAALQTIGGGQPFRTFNLSTNNSAGILLNNNLEVSGVHSFVSGIISSSATPNYLVYQSTATYTGAADPAHVSGWVKRFGTSNFAFPVGNGTALRPISVTALSGASEYNVRHQMATPNRTNTQAPILSVDAFEYWTVNQISGGTTQLLLNWNKPKVNFPNYALGDIRVVYNNAGVWVNRGGNASGDVNTTGTITSTAVSTYGNFTMGSVSASLPLTFAGVWALAEQGYNTIQWKTAGEYNVDRFEIQRSSDGANFNTLAQKAATNTPVVQSYEWLDRLPLPGESWYRIRSVDITGEQKISQVVLVRAGNRGNEFRVVNHIVSNTIYLAISNKYKGAYTWQLLNGAGQVVQSGRLNISQSGIVSIPVTTQGLHGTYVFRLYNPAHKLVDKLTIQ